MHGGGVVEELLSKGVAESVACVMEPAKVDVPLPSGVGRCCVQATMRAHLWWPISQICASPRGFVTRLESTNLGLGIVFDLTAVLCQRCGQTHARIPAHAPGFDAGLLHSTHAGRRGVRFLEESISGSFGKPG